MSDDWFITMLRRPHAPVQLFCLPHAGAGAAAYVKWPSAAGDGVEIHAFVPPGRERRITEKPEVDPARIAEAVAARADRPFALFGHSMGARVAFEVVRALRRSGGPLPCRLLVSGCTAPDAGNVGGPYEDLSGLGDEELLAAVVRGGAMPEEILAERDLLDLLLPAFRADFAWLDAYAYRAEPPLPVPVSAFAGQADPSATPLHMERWRRHTAAGFVLRTFDGGHFFHQLHLDAVLRLIRADLATDTTGAADTAGTAPHPHSRTASGPPAS